MVGSRWVRCAALLTLLLAIAAPARADRDLVGVTQAKFAWSAASGPVVGYRIYVERNGGGFLPHPTTPTKPDGDRVVVVTGNYGDVIRVQVAAVSAPPSPRARVPTPRSGSASSRRRRRLLRRRRYRRRRPRPRRRRLRLRRRRLRPVPTPPPGLRRRRPLTRLRRRRPGGPAAARRRQRQHDGLDHGRERTEQRLRVGALPPTSAITGNGDYDGDGHADLLSRDDTTGRLHAAAGEWRGRGRRSGACRLSPDWELAGSGDFDGDGRDDVLLRNAGGRRLEIWFMNGPQIVWRAPLRDPFNAAAGRWRASPTSTATGSPTSSGTAR